MSGHVHVRLRKGLGVNNDGELVEQFHCRCGEEWTKTHPVEEGQSDQ
ncbi:hypothetical protein [Kitasatospora purpeofusca]|nr:hypothetical protein [Kitasatospora purpeofusca]MCX4759013.1 hypothetical protein [Kitasatospora purpeofusca]WSR30569.1 hypothetical protein OG715_06100 [Kitasatospora purpeofusca]WSR38809.1 hypothetical protein OG196_06745 [Kitasatospora purpeofusca]